MPTPQLLDEIIGCIFSHIKPKSLGLLYYRNIDHATLKTCCLVSRQFAYWGRHHLYKMLHLATPIRVAHYLSLCRRYSDMPSHVKILYITMIEEDWSEGDPATGVAHDNLASLLDILAERGAVQSFRLFLVKSWDRLPTDLQSSVLRFLFSKCFQSLDLASTCHCFPISYIPLPYAAKRFSLLKIEETVGEDDGQKYWSCPEWEKEKRELGAGKGPRELKKELLDTITSSFHRLGNEFFHPEKAKLESLWIPAGSLPEFEPQLHLPEQRPCIENLRELHVLGICDRDIPTIARVIEGSRHTLESLCLRTIRVQSATSSHLSLLTSVELPRLHTLTIITDIIPDVQSSPADECMKSFSWYLLHAGRSQKLTRSTIKSLNLVFIGSVARNMLFGRLWLGTSTNNPLIRKVFDTFKFFKLEKSISDLVAGGGKVNLWFMLEGIPGPLAELQIEEGMEKQFPNLVKEGRITSTLGQCEEGFMLPDALSIFPEVSAQTGYETSFGSEELALTKETIKPILKAMRQNQN